MAKEKAVAKRRKKRSKKENCTPKQARFAEYYCLDEEIYGNATRCYAKAYGIDISEEKGYSVAHSAAVRLLQNVSVLEYMGELIDNSGLNNAFVDFQLLNLIKQDEDKATKLRAIQEFNKLRARIKDAETPRTPLSELLDQLDLDEPRIPGDGERLQIVQFEAGAAGTYRIGDQITYRNTQNGERINGKEETQQANENPCQAGKK